MGQLETRAVCLPGSFAGANHIEREIVYNCPNTILSTDHHECTMNRMSGGGPMIASSPMNLSTLLFPPLLKPSVLLLDSSREEKIEQLEQMVLSLQREVLSLKRKVQYLEASSFKEQEPTRHPCEASELFNGYTRGQLKEAIRFDQKISTACKTLLYKLFSSDYIQSHSITGRRGNTFREAKPMMDERCIKIIRVLLKQKFGDHLSDTVITEKIQNVQKALRQKFKTECL